MLAWILSRVVTEFAGVPVRDIADKYIVGEPEVGTTPVNRDKTNAPRDVRQDRNEDGTTTEVMLHPGKADAELARLYAGGWEHSFTSEDTAILSPAVRAAFEAHALSSVNFAALARR